jgi:hypothetical protein
MAGQSGRDRHPWDPSMGGELRVEERQPRGSQSALELPTAG